MVWRHGQLPQTKLVRSWNQLSILIEEVEGDWTYLEGFPVAVLYCFKYFGRRIGKMQDPCNPCIGICSVIKDSNPCWTMYILQLQHKFCNFGLHTRLYQLFSSCNCSFFVAIMGSHRNSFKSKMFFLYLGVGRFQQKRYQDNSLPTASSMDCESYLLKLFFSFCLNRFLYC